MTNAIIVVGINSNQEFFMQAFEDIQDGLEYLFYLEHIKHCKTTWLCEREINETGKSFTPIW